MLNKICVTCPHCNSSKVLTYYGVKSITMCQACKELYSIVPELETSNFKVIPVARDFEGVGYDLVIEDESDMWLYKYPEYVWSHNISK